MLRPFTVSILLMFLFACSTTQTEVTAPNPRSPNSGLSNPVGPTGTELFEGILSFQSRVDDAFSSYAGVSFGGLEPYLGNLIIYFSADSEVQEARAVLLDIFGELEKEVEIYVWPQRETKAGESLKTAFGQIWGEHTLSADYDEINGRVMLGLDTLDVVSEYETRILETFDIERDAFGLTADTAACPSDLQVRFEPEALTLEVGDSSTVDVKVLTCGGTVEEEVEVTWTSSNPAVATVNSDSGLVTAIAPGQAKMKAETNTSPFGELGEVSITVE